MEPKMANSTSQSEWQVEASTLYRGSHDRIRSQRRTPLQYERHEGHGDGIYYCKDFPHRDLGATEETEKAEVPGDCRCMRPYFNSSLGTIKTACLF